jgi:hypothetical protein
MLEVTSAATKSAATLRSSGLGLGRVVFAIGG